MQGRNSHTAKKKAPAKSTKQSAKPKVGNKNKRKRQDPKKPFTSSKRLKVDETAARQPAPEESDEELMPEDEKFFLEHGEYLNILDNMSTQTQQKPRRKKEDANREENYEQSGARRNREWEEKKKPTKLPVLVGSKMVVQPQPEADQENDETSAASSDEESIDDADEDDGVEQMDGNVSAFDDSDGDVEVLSDEMLDATEDLEATDLSPEDIELRVFMQRQERIAEAKQQIALLASSVLEDPEENLSKLKELHKLCNHEDSTVRKLAILSELAVLKDIIPSYRIIADGEDQSGVTLSKEVKKVREFETGLLKAYQRYLRTLEEIIKKALEVGKANRKTLKLQRRQQAGDNSADPALQHKLVIGVSSAAVKALGELLSTQYHFNFRANLIAALVPVMDCKHDELSEIACTYMTSLFKNDTKGSCSLEAVRAMFQLIKQRHYSVRPEILLTFLALPLSTEMSDDVDIFDQKPQQSSKKHLSKKQKKARKEKRALDKEMQQAAAEQSREERIRIQTETLKALFLLYFKVLKNLQKSPLLAPVLEGLSRFAHLINMDLLTNLLELLKDLVSKNKLTLASSLHCIVTAFQTFKLQGETLEVDLKDFYAHFYKIMPDVFSAVSQHKQLMPLTLRALDLMLTNKRLFAIERTAAYIKRLLMVSLQSSPNAIMAILKIVYDLLRKYPRTQQLLDSEFTGSGLYNPELDDPEHCNAFASTAWEFLTLMKHFHPAIAKFAHLTLKAEPMTISSTAQDLFRQYSFEANFFFPPPPKPKQHPLYKAMEKSTKKGRKQAYYVERETGRVSSAFIEELQLRSTLSDDAVRLSMKKVSRL